MGEMAWSLVALQNAVGVVLVVVVQLGPRVAHGPRNELQRRDSRGKVSNTSGETPRPWRQVGGAYSATRPRCRRLRRTCLTCDSSLASERPCLNRARKAVIASAPPIKQGRSESARRAKRSTDKRKTVNVEHMRPRLPRSTPPKANTEGAAEQSYRAT